MGLAVSVYKNIKESNEEDYDFIAYVIDDDWLDRIKNLKNDCYYKGELDESVGVSYAYSSHNRFRVHLAEMLGISRHNWFDEDFVTKETPFTEFFHFADNEGSIDFETSKELYKDFKDYLEKAEKNSNNGFFETYKDWMNIFESASENGVVVYN
ncbi:hypothetical protein [Tenacibaculum sp. 190524A02b]|uniref:hypothetical protein n=1 Tax=Tenacibaculum vairaonense TaxID=3137860 RepID=UPI0031FA9321